jgi:hypothetical protein
MTTNEMHEFKNIMMGITEIYGVEFSGAAFQIYLNAVAHIDIDTIREAVNEHVKKIPEGRFYPKPCEIIGYHENKLKKIEAEKIREINLRHEKKLELENFVSGEIAALRLDAATNKKNITCTTHPSTLAYVEKLGGWEEILKMYKQNLYFFDVMTTGFFGFELSRRQLANHPGIPVSSNLHLVKN